jgi:hypothetical protein
MKFVCKKCGKTINLQPPVEKAYARQELCLWCRAEAKKKPGR